MNPETYTNHDPLLPPDGEPAYPITGRIPVIEEQLQLGKRIIETGRVLIQKSVTEREETVTMPLNRDEVNVERVLVNRYVDTPPPVRYEGDTMIIPVLEEVVVVEKRLMLIEELHVTKRQTQTIDTQQVTLRKEAVTITRQPGQTPGDDPVQQTN